MIIKIYKTFFLLIVCFCLFLMPPNVRGQTKGDVRLFAGAIYGSDFAELGINLGGEYLVSDKVALAPSFSFYLVESPSSIISINIDARYYFLKENIQVYGLGGLIIERAKLEILNRTVTDSKSGINIGGGIIIPVTDNIGINLQGKVSTPGNNQAVIQGGVIFSI